MITETLNDAEVFAQIDLIEENSAECGRQSSYTRRNKPYLKTLYIEASRRGLATP